MGIKKFLLGLVMVIGFTLTGLSQSGWSTGNYYAYEGRSTTETVYRNEWNAYYGMWVQVRYCRQLNWYREYHSGYIYLWNSYTGRWYSEFREGYFWYCTWGPWIRC